MKKRATKIPYEGYTLPPSAEKGGSFVDFKQAYREAPTRVPVKKVKVKKKNERSNGKI
tara:strand:+ start:311 stop:484 length:174 start_codon:yes stop_codon:yes gene_type:complete